MKRTMNFVHERSTKNTERYAEDAPKIEQAIGVLYVQRTAFNGTVPTELTVTIESI